MADNHKKATLPSSDAKQISSYIYWQDGEWWLGYLKAYPDYWTQGRTQKELEENLLAILNGVTP